MDVAVGVDQNLQVVLDSPVRFPATGHIVNGLILCSVVGKDILFDKGGLGSRASGGEVGEPAGGTGFRPGERNVHVALKVDRDARAILPATILESLNRPAAIRGALEDGEGGAKRRESARRGGGARRAGSRRGRENGSGELS